MANCKEWEDQRRKECTKWEDQRRRVCVEWETKQEKSCASWSPWFRWLCIAWTWITTTVCKAYTWVGSIVCKAYTWVGSIVCKVYEAVIEPLVNIVFDAFNICPDKWHVDPGERLTPVPPSALPPDLQDLKRRKRLILCCDGGGIKGIITLRCLKALEEKWGARCIDIFDMFAGTSTGSIIAAALAFGLPLSKIIELYEKKHREIFTRTFFNTSLGRVAGATAAGAALGGAFGFLAGLIPGAILGFLTGATLGLILSAILVAIDVDIPLVVPIYMKQPIQCILKSVFGQATLADCKRDIFITSKDTVRSETTYFTAFHKREGVPTDCPEVYGCYKDVQIRHAVEASMSGPIYFSPLGRFLDGGVGSFNNPCYIASVEALRYSFPQQKCSKNDQLQPACRPYDPGEVKVISFGTGTTTPNISDGKAKDIIISLGWLDFLIEEGFDDANNQQTYVAIEELEKRERAIEITRYQVFLNDDDTLKLGVVKPPGLKKWTDLKMDSIDFFDVIEQIGSAFADFLKATDSNGKTKLDLQGVPDEVKVTPDPDVAQKADDFDKYRQKVMSELLRESP